MGEWHSLFTGIYGTVFVKESYKGTDVAEIVYKISLD